ncbi:MAG TPA: thioesterase domain-containing protein [Bryobacteraceae bacterium]|nr:thioesterase domain-containing protein [Bryobacteraceae bacterium]
MRILLAHNSLYYPSHGGGDISNRLLMEALATRGHACRVVARLSTFSEDEHRRFVRDLAARQVELKSSAAGAAVFDHRGVEVHVLTENPNLRGYFAGQVREFSPSVILASTDDPAQLLLEASLLADGPRVVYLVRATLALPFGPDAAFPSELKAQMLRNVDGVVGVSRYVAGYVRRWSGIEAIHVPISLMEPGPFPDLGRFDNEFVTLVNPCAVKGISIFLALAERMPGVQFAAVPTWGTNTQDRAALQAYANIAVLDPVDDIDEILKRTRVLLVPSLWAEARSRIIVEAMLRGVPVIASDVGGIPEAKMGVDYLLPVRPIERYQPKVDEQMVPVAEVPRQDIGPWEEVLRRLVTDRRHYEQLSRASHEAAVAYVENLSVAPLESYLEETVRAPARPRLFAPVETAAPSPVDKLSPEKRRLLALRLQRTVSAATPSDSWFPTAVWRERKRLRLFCFPSAGGGTSSFRGWSESLPPEVLICPVRLPGRESRLSEPPFRSMETLIAELAKAIEPYLSQPYAFFGHSMGAAVAFELVRRLRRQGLPPPAGLFVSGARAPQFRLGHVPAPEPSDEEFLDELRRLEGVPAAILENRELLQVILPALRADTELYRNYVYVEEPPLACPIRAYGGVGDPNVKPEHLGAWGRQTTVGFSLRTFDGGHFFVDSARDEFLRALAGDLGELVSSAS